MTACEGLIPSDCNNPDCPAHAADRDDLAAVLAKHERWKPSSRGLLIIECDPCGHLMGIGPEPIDPNDAHRAHVAQCIVEAGWHQ